MIIRGLQALAVAARSTCPKLSILELTARKHTIQSLVLIPTYVCRAAELQPRSEYRYLPRAPYSLSPLFSSPFFLSSAPPPILSSRQRHLSLSPVAFQTNPCCFALRSRCRVSPYHANNRKPWFVTLRRCFFGKKSTGVDCIRTNIRLSVSCWIGHLVVETSRRRTS